MNTTTPESTPLSPLGRFVEAVRGRERWLLLLGVGVQLAVLFFMTAKGTLILAHGDVYFVRVQPVDPRDLMRGDYVILSYEFSRIPHDHRADWFDGNPHGRHHPEAGRPTYVTLVREGDGKHWRAARFSQQRPKQGPFLKGMLNERGLLAFGIEQYFVQEGKGRDYENAVRSGQLTAEIAITPEGTAAMRGLHILGK